MTVFAFGVAAALGSTAGRGAGLAAARSAALVVTAGRGATETTAGRVGAAGAATFAVVAGLSRTAARVVTGALPVSGASGVSTAGRCVGTAEVVERGAAAGLLAAWLMPMATTAQPPTASDARQEEMTRPQDM